MTRQHLARESGEKQLTTDIVTDKTGIYTVTMADESCQTVGRFPAGHECTSSWQESQEWTGLLRDTGGATSWSESVNVNNILRELQHTMNPRLQESITLNMHLPDRLPEVRGDQRQLLLAFLQLVLNAQDAMPDGGVLSVVASVMSESQMRERFLCVVDNLFVCVAVADTGVGIDIMTQQHIFEPFFTTKVPGKGHGLGLAVVHRIIESHGGFVSVSSELSGGTIVLVFLPIKSPARASV